MKPAWQLLLEHRRNFGFGLTFPFLLGASQTTPGLGFQTANEAREAFGTMLASMRSTEPEDYKVRIHHCGDIDQPVAGLVYMPQGTWCVEAGPLLVSSEFEPIEHLEDLLWERTGPFILAAEFSRINGKQQCFSEEDHIFITEALAAQQGAQPDISASGGNGS